MGRPFHPSVTPYTKDQAKFATSAYPLEVCPVAPLLPFSIDSQVACAHVSFLQTSPSLKEAMHESTGDTARINARFALPLAAVRADGSGCARWRRGSRS